MVRALYVGRFQPFHKGHLEAVKSILSECGEVVVAIGSSQRSHEPDNLFTAGERVEMAYESLKEAGLADRCLIVCVPDINYNALWVRHVSVLSPRFDVVYSNNSLVSTLFREAGAKVKQLKAARRKEFDGTHVRGLMLRGGEWEKLLPPAAARVALKAKAASRLREVVKGDKI